MSRLSTRKAESMMTLNPTYFRVCATNLQSTTKRSFFKNDILSSLFDELIPEIMRDEYTECPGRLDNRVEAMKRRANQDS